MNFKPLLAATVLDIGALKLPLLVSPKIDGIRCLYLCGQAVSRNLKPIRNRYIQACLKGLPDGLDGELVVGRPCGDLVFNRTTSGVMSEGGEPDFRFFLFDQALSPGGFFHRYHDLAGVQSKHTVIVPHWQVHTLRDLTKYEQALLEEGYEGVMLRKPDGPYKFGRSTLSEGILMKLKRFRDGEVRITGFEEGWHNLNDATTDALGRTRRSTHQDNMVGNGQIGTIRGIDLKTGLPLVIAPGRMTQAERIDYFEHPDRLLGRVGRYKTFDYGKVNAPRFCTFQGFRDPEDL